MNIEYLKEKLYNGPVKFSYKKKDGSVRTALGTLNMNVIPEEHHPSGSQNPPLNDDVQRYYDLNSGGWRSFIIENLLDNVIEEYTEGT